MKREHVISILLNHTAFTQAELHAMSDDELRDVYRQEAGRRNPILRPENPPFIDIRVG